MRSNINFKSVFIPENSEEGLMSCEICCERSATQDNQLVFCELCNLGVHQYCYGNPLSVEIPEGDWYCDRCKYCIENNLDPSRIKCALCSYSVGSLKRLKSNKWAHIICVNWIPEIYFENSLEKNSLSFMNKFNFRKRKHKLCYLCGSNEGYCISCEHGFRRGRCQKFYHVYCAKKHKIIFSERLMSIYLFDSKNKYIKTFCLDHLKKEFSENKDFALEEGLKKEKDEHIQKEIIMNRTCLDENQIKPDESEHEEFIFQYKQLMNYLMGNHEESVLEIPTLKKTAPTHPILIENQEIENNKKEEKNLTQDKKFPDLKNLYTEIHNEKTLSFKPPPLKKKIKIDSPKNMNETRFFVEISENEEIEDSSSQNSNSSEEESKESGDAKEIAISGIEEFYVSSRSVQSGGKTPPMARAKQPPIRSRTEIDQFPKPKSNQIQPSKSVLKPSEDSPQYNNESRKIIKNLTSAKYKNESTAKKACIIINENQFEANLPQNAMDEEQIIESQNVLYDDNGSSGNCNLITLISSESEEKEKEKSLVKVVNEPDDDFFYLKDVFNRYEVVDKLRNGQILSIETLKQNHTFTHFFENLHYGRSKIQYLDNPFLPKPLDKIQINDLESLGQCDADEFDLKALSFRMLNFKRKQDEEDRNIIMEKMWVDEQKEKKMDEEKKSEEVGEFLTKIADKFVYVNNFDFEGLPYHKNK